MGDHHDGLAELAHGGAHERQDLGAGARVEVAGRLVGEDDLGAAGERSGDGDPLLLAARELGRAVPQAVRRDRRSSTTWSNHSAIGLAAGEAGGQRDVLGRGERRDEVERLEDEADAVAAQLRELAVVELRDVGVADEHGARGEVVEPGDAVHQRRLARARRAHDRGEAAGGELDGHAVEGADLVLAAAVDLDGVDDAGGRRAPR